MDSIEIQKILPHRYPFLLVDRVVEFEPNARLLAYKNVTFNEPFFQGHFPGHPVMPGVLMVEALAQAGGLLAYKSGAFEPGKTVMYLMSLDGVKFRRPVTPGDKLMLEVTVIRQKREIWKLKGLGTVDGVKCVEAEIMATIANLAEPVAAPAAPAAPAPAADPKPV
jgi:3-hydroxyacyl-[acyl-carrier-protein] dehydratase